MEILHEKLRSVNALFRKPDKLAICVPWQSPYMYTRTVDSLLGLEHPSGYQVRFIRSGGWSPALRHLSACEAAMAWGADYICIVGADQLYEPDMLCRLVARMEEGYEAVACMVPTRGFLAWNHGMVPFGKVAWRFKASEDGLATTARQYHGQAVDPDMLELIDPRDGVMQQCHFIGSGVLMFRREHLDAMAKPWFYESVDPLTQQRYASMDTRFAFRLQMEGGATLWVDTSIPIRHLHIFAIDDSFPERFADWATPHPMADADIFHYLPTAMPTSTTADAREDYQVMTPPSGQAALPVAFFDAYRANYGTMSFAEHQRTYSIIHRVYPQQSCYDYDGASAFFALLCTHGVAPSILELGGWKGELAEKMLARYPQISHWYNIEICQEASIHKIYANGRYAANSLGEFFWESKPRFVRMCNTLVLSHVVEHMRLQDFAATIAHCADQGIAYVYLDIPHIQQHTAKNWRGWPNTHIFEGTWTDIDTVMTAHGYASIPLAKDAAALTPRMYASPQGIRVLQKQEQEAYASV